MFVSLGLPGNGYQEKIQRQEIYWWGGGWIGSKSRQGKLSDQDTRLTFTKGKEGGGRIH